MNEQIPQSMIDLVAALVNGNNVSKNQNFVLKNEKKTPRKIYCAFSTTDLPPDYYQAVKKACQAWQDIANIEFYFISDNQIHRVNPLIQFHYQKQSVGDREEGVKGRCYGNILIDDHCVLMLYGDEDENFDPQSILYSSLIHEIGHALGLDHPGNYAGENRKSFFVYDNNHFTVMSYNYHAVSRDILDQIHPSSPMMADQLAVQHIYGRKPAEVKRKIINFKKDEDNFKTLNTNAFHVTLDASKTEETCYLDVRPGFFSTIGLPISYNFEHLSSNVATPYGQLIETIMGGNKDDFLIGNDADNILRGNDGFDTLVGGKGNDLLLGGGGNDVYYFLEPDSGHDMILDQSNSKSESNINYLFFREAINDLSIEYHPNGILLKRRKNTVLVRTNDLATIRIIAKGECYQIIKQDHVLTFTNADKTDAVSVFCYYYNFNIGKTTIYSSLKDENHKYLIDCYPFNDPHITSSITSVDIYHTLGCDKLYYQNALVNSDQILTVPIHQLKHLTIQAVDKNMLGHNKFLFTFNNHEKRIYSSNIRLEARVGYMNELFRVNDTRIPCEKTHKVKLSDCIQLNLSNDIEFESFEVVDHSFQKMNSKKRFTAPEMTPYFVFSSEKAMRRKILTKEGLFSTKIVLPSWCSHRSGKFMFSIRAKVKGSQKWTPYKSFYVSRLLNEIYTPQIFVSTEELYNEYEDFHLKNATIYHPSEKERIIRFKVWYNAMNQENGHLVTGKRILRMNKEHHLTKQEFDDLRWTSFSVGYQDISMQAQYEGAQKWSPVQQYKLSFGPKRLLRWAD